MDINTDQLTLTPPRNQKRLTEEKKHNLIKNSILALSVVLILISLTTHIGIIAAAVQYFTEEGRAEQMLISGTLPDYTIVTSIKAEEVSPESDLWEAESEKSEKDGDISISQNGSIGNLHGFALKNETSYNPDLDVLFNSPNPIEKTDELYEKYTEDAPLVLIYHTHATESYSDTNKTGAYRTSDPKGNMIAVGKVLHATLAAEGIKAIHLTEAFDAEDFNTAYLKSSAAVQMAMDTYPSIKYVIDLHRDSITDEKGNSLSASFTYNGEGAAQIMFVVGTDEGGSGHSGWRQNLTTALHVQDMLFSTDPSSIRAINLRKASFYQDKSPGAMLLEIGSSGNTLKEAKRSAVILGCTLAEYITGKTANISVDDMLTALDLN